MGNLAIQRRAFEFVEYSTMSLADKQWKEISWDEVVAAFLQGEDYQFMKLHNASIINNPNFSEPTHNALRSMLLQLIRGGLTSRIPLDTVWYKVHSLTDHELDELYVIGRSGWDYDPNHPDDNKHSRDNNELRRVAARRPERLRDKPADWTCPILWGHDKFGPFSIMEGNHRLVAYSAAPSSLDVDVIIGLSAARCPWHILDPL